MASTFRYRDQWKKVHQSVAVTNELARKLDEKVHPDYNKNNVPPLEDDIPQSQDASRPILPGGFTSAPTITQGSSDAWNYHAGPSNAAYTAQPNPSPMYNTQQDNHYTLRNPNGTYDYGTLVYQSQTQTPVYYASPSTQPGPNGAPVSVKNEPKFAYPNPNGQGNPLGQYYGGQNHEERQPGAEFGQFYPQHQPPHGRANTYPPPPPPPPPHGSYVARQDSYPNNNFLYCHVHQTYYPLSGRCPRCYPCG